MKPKPLLAASLLVCLAAAIPQTAKSAQYAARDLGGLPGMNMTFPTDINDKGQAVGVSRNDSTQTGAACIWEPGSTPAAIPGFTYHSAQATGINESGQVSVWNMGGGYIYCWSKTTGSTYVGWGAVNRINESGVMVGTCNSGYNIWHPATWAVGAGSRDLGTLSGTQTGCAFDINDQGTVVGQCYLPSNVFYTRAFKWTSGGGMVELPTLGGAYSTAAGINDKGQIVGESVAGDGKQHATLWNPDGSLVDLGLLSGGSTCCAWDINEAGQAVGFGYDASGYLQAVFWDADHQMSVLSALPGDNGGEASAINNLGQIVGDSRSNSGIRAVIWTPVPEPSSLSALLCGVCGFGVALKKRR